LFGWIAVGIAALVGGVMLAVAYAFVFELVTRSAAWWIGAALGAMNAVALWLSAGVLAGMFPDVALGVADELSILFNSLPVMAGLVLAHVVYGAVVAARYAPTKRRPADDMVVTWHEI